MNNESGEIAAQLRGIRKVLSFAAGCLAVMVATLVASNAYYIADDMRENKEAVMGRTYYDQSDFLATERKWDELLALAKSRQRTNPTDAHAFWFEGIAHYNQEKWDEAIAAFKKAADVNPGWENQSRRWIEAARKQKTNSKAEQLSS